MHLRGASEATLRPKANATSENAIILGSRVAAAASNFKTSLLHVAIIIIRKIINNSIVYSTFESQSRLKNLASFHDLGDCIGDSSAC